MNISQETLTKIQSMATICSVIAIPLVIAIVGWRVQIALSDEGIKKDYVQMAAGILNEGGKQKDDELRKWAVAVLNKSSPVPFSKELRTELEQGKPLYGIPMPPESVMLPPPELDRLTDKTGADLLRNMISNAKKYHETADNLRFLQNWIRIANGHPSSSSQVVKP